MEKRGKAFRAFSGCQKLPLSLVELFETNGPFTEEEEKLVTKLHFSLGNQWAKMALEISGRTDNEIKNFWNTRTKNLQRQGLPVYPPEWQEQATNSMIAHQIQDSLEPNSVENQNLYNLMRHSPDLYNLLAFPNIPNSNHYGEPEPVLPYMDGYAMDEQSSQLSDYSLSDTHLIGNDSTYPSLPTIQEVGNMWVSSFQCFDHGNFGAQYSTPTSTLESDNAFISDYSFVNRIPDSHLIGNDTYSDYPSLPTIHEAGNMGVSSFQSFDHGNFGAQYSTPTSTLESDNAFISDHQPPECSSFCQYHSR